MEESYAGNYCRHAKVGRNLAEQLQAEDIDITLVDVIADKINDLCENYRRYGNRR